LCISWINKRLYNYQSLTTHTHTQTHARTHAYNSSLKAKTAICLTMMCPSFLKLLKSVYLVTDQIPTPLCRCAATNREHILHF